MSIEFRIHDPARCSLSSLIARPRVTADDQARSRRKTSPRRLAANRRNAQRSTGPRSQRGKKRSSLNALKHGLSARTALLETEDRCAYEMHLAELEEELQPRTALQRMLFDEIVSLSWRLLRLPAAQNRMYTLELDKCADPDAPQGETLSPSEVLARRFSDDRNNGFALLGRYERGTQNTLLRLLARFDAMKKGRPTAPYGPDDRDARVPREGDRSAAPSADERAAQMATFARRRAELDHHIPPKSEYEAGVDLALWATEQQRRDAAAAAAAAAEKRTRSNPTQNRTAAADSAKCSKKFDDRVTKRTHRGTRLQPVLEPDARVENPCHGEGGQM